MSGNKNNSNKDGHQSGIFIDSSGNNGSGHGNTGSIDNSSRANYQIYPNYPNYQNYRNYENYQNVVKPSIEPITFAPFCVQIHFYESNGESSKRIICKDMGDICLDYDARATIFYVKSKYKLLQPVIICENLGIDENAYGNSLMGMVQCPFQNERNSGMFTIYYGSNEQYARLLKWIGYYRLHYNEEKKFIMVPQECLSQRNYYCVPEDYSSNPNFQRFENMINARKNRFADGRRVYYRTVENLIGAGKRSRKALARENAIAMASIADADAEPGASNNNNGNNNNNDNDDDGKDDINMNDEPGNVANGDNANNNDNNDNNDANNNNNNDDNGGGDEGATNPQTMAADAALRRLENLLKM